MFLLSFLSLRLSLTTARIFPITPDGLAKKQQDFPKAVHRKSNRPVLVSPGQSCPEGILGSPVSCALSGLPKLGEAPLILQPHARWPGQLF